MASQLTFIHMDSVDNMVVTVDKKDDADYFTLKIQDDGYDGVVLFLTTEQLDEIVLKIERGRNS